MLKRNRNIIFIKTELPENPNNKESRGKLMIMKKVILLFFLCVSTTVFSQISKTVTDPNGSLDAKLTTEELNTTTNLTITGLITNNDFYTMRDKMPVLSVIDLSQSYYAISTIIPYNAFSSAYNFSDSGKTTLTSVTLPTRCERIEGSAFLNCTNLRTVNITTTNSILYGIGTFSFYGCTSLQSINIPSSVTYISDYAFYGCTSLTNVNIPASVSNLGNSEGFNPFQASNAYIYVAESNPYFSSVNGVLLSKDKTKLIQCTKYTSGNYTIPATVNTVGQSAFFNCDGITWLTIPSSVTTISNYAFQNCTGITDLAIPASVTSIYGNAFLGCNMNVLVNSNNPNYSSLDGQLFDKYQNTIIAWTNHQNSSYVIPLSVYAIGDFSFYSEDLTSIEIPSSVSFIGKSAFNWSGISTVKIPSSVTSIGDYAFQNCQKLSSLNIPPNINYLGSYVFSYNPSLTSIIAESNTPLDLSSSPRTFYNVDKTKCTLYVPVGSKVFYQNTDQWKDFEHIVEGTASVGKIETNSVNVYCINGVLYVSGVASNELIYVYKENGILIGKYKSTGKNNILLPSQGVYIVNIKNYSTKVIYK